MTVISRFIQAVSHGGSMRPTLQVVHSAETPLRAGYAYSIAKNWFGTSAETSAHFMVDPVEIIRMLSDNVVAYAVGPVANGFTLNWEQAGYARFTRAEWTTDDGMDQLRLLGAGLRERGLANGIPLRWATDDQIRAARYGTPGGICTHDDIRRVLGGTTHTDPMPYYPRDLLQQAWSGDPLEEDPLAQLSDRAVALLEEIVEVYIPGKAGRTPGAGWSRIDATNRNVASLQVTVAGQNAAITKLADAIASGRDDLTADELRQAVSQGIQEAGAALKAVQDAEPAV